MEGIDPQTAVQISSLIGFDIANMTIVGLIVGIIVPFIVVWYALYLLLWRMPIIRNDTIKKIIGAFMSFLVLRVGSARTIAMWLGFAGIIVFKFDRLHDKILAIIVFVFLIMQMQSIYTLRGLFIVGCLIATLISILKINSFIRKIIAIAAIFAIYYFFSPYVATMEAQVGLTI